MKSTFIAITLAISGVAATKIRDARTSAQFYFRPVMYTHPTSATLTNINNWSTFFVPMCTGGSIPCTVTPPSSENIFNTHLLVSAIRQYGGSIPPQWATVNKAYGQF